MNKLMVTFLALMATVAGVALAADAKNGADVFNSRANHVTERVGQRQTRRW